MKRISDAVKADIRRRINLAEIISEAGVQLTRSGKEWRGRCPFEPRSTNPSKFAVNEQTYHCYGCEASGDVFSWLQAWLQLGFPDAVVEAARRANVTLPTGDDGHELSAMEMARRDRSAARGRAYQEALAILAELSRVTALGCDDRQRLGIPDGMSIDAVIDAGEVGLLPSAHQMQQRLDALAVSQHARVDTGISDALSTLADQWIVWARRHEQIIGGRMFEAAGGLTSPRIGMAGSRTHGWLQASAGERRSRHLVIAGDDATYVALRASGLGGVYRPLSAESLAGIAHSPWFEGDRSPPVYVLRPTESTRRRAFEELVPLLAVHPRCRVTEVDPLTAPGGDITTWRTAFDHVLEQSGTAFDWQTQVLAAHRAFDTESGRLGAATRLGHLATATASAIERLTYLQEIEALTGLSCRVSGAGEHVPRLTSTQLNRRALGTPGKR